MKKGFLREKAIFQIILLITAVVYFSYAIKPVEAASDECCEKLASSDDYCVYTAEASCDPAYKHEAVSCELTSYCKLGCCYDLDEGMCYRSVPQTTCLNTTGGEWYIDETCDSTTVCQPGCCVVGSQCRFTTEQSCAIQTANYPELEMIFHSDILTESECQDICRAGDNGCCVNTDDSCVYETRESCEAAEGEFYYEQYCSSSNVAAICGCIEHSSKTCYDDDVYWVDSCGNTEEIAADCDYAQGTICRSIAGNYTCGSVNCATTYSDTKNTHDNGIGGSRDNGESWCIYESPVGAALDRPGTRHYRHLCVNGEEVVEPCRDYREEICIQAEKEGKMESSCLHNDIYDSIITTKISSVPKGQEFWETTTTTTSTTGTATCSEGNSDCPVAWRKRDVFDDWDCEANCDCEKDAHVKQMADYCKFMGDCGADYNVLGKYTDDGFSVTSKGRDGPAWALSASQKQEWNKYGVYGGMIGLYEIILKFIEAILASGTKAGKDLKKLDEELKQRGTYAMGGLAVGGYLALTTVGFVGAALPVAWMQTAASISWCWVCLIVLVVIIIIIYLLTQTGKNKTYHVKTECSEWVAPTGGADCDKCLDQKKVEELGFYESCTEYKCKSLGLNCEFISENEGTERVACYDANPNDANSPIISPWEETLTQGFNVSTISNISQGYGITPEVPYYEKISFGIETDELSQCKISQEHTDTYDLMVSYFGDSYYQLEHNTTINPQVGGQVYDYYVRCQDPSGNPNAAEYVIRFTTTDEPDKMSPTIEGTSIEDYGYVAANINETGLAIYVNEPAECNWSSTDQKYDEMENSFYCPAGSNTVLGYETYECSTALDTTTEGLNTYFFRCEDASGNPMQQSHPFHLTKTDELTITSQSPEGTLLDTISPTLTVTTSGGAENGKATCYFSDDNTRDISLWPEFYETDSTVHSQQLLSLAQREHNYYIICKDIALNEANTTITFTIDKDLIPPELEYVYMDTVVLHIILDEPSTCEYSSETFNYGEGNVMSGAGTTHNTVSAAGKYYYINCEDVYENHWDSPIIVYL